MAAIVGHVTEIDGEFIATAEDGTTRVLEAGDPVYENETVVGSPDNSTMHHVIVSLDEAGSEVLVTADQAQLFDAQLRPVEFSTLDTQSQPDTLAAMLKEFGDIDDIETAAGEDVGLIESSEDVDAGFEEHIDRAVDVEAGASPEATQIYSVAKDFNRLEDEIIESVAAAAPTSTL
ncbi:MAG: hypothetical protein R3302_06235, partial [Sulfurimonadaceae bacterium]|nr:hypothetical protein [Sulfurimonadaceae bacterium]